MVQALGNIFANLRKLANLKNLTGQKSQISGSFFENLKKKKSEKIFFFVKFNNKKIRSQEIFFQNCLKN